MGKTFGTRFKSLRNELGLTQDDLAKEFNKRYFYSFTKSSISMYENNKQVPEIDVLQKWADFFQVSTDYILGKSDIRNPYENHQRISESIKDDKELLEFWEVLKEREDLQLLFKQTKQMTEKDIRQIIKIIKAIEDEEDAQN